MSSDGTSSSNGTQASYSATKRCHRMIVGIGRRLFWQGMGHLILSLLLILWLCLFRQSGIKYASSLARIARDGKQGFEKILEKRGIDASQGTEVFEHWVTGRRK